MAYTKDIGIKNFYEHYEARAIKKGREYIPYKLYTAILRDFNLKVRNRIVYEAEHIKLPYRLGKLFIHKFENNYSEDNKKGWAVDFKKTKELGHVVYHGSKFGYKWKWDKTDSNAKGKRYFQFKPARTSSRLIADAILNKKLDYYRYDTWYNKPETGHKQII